MRISVASRNNRSNAISKLQAVSNQRGFTLIEIMVTLVVVGVVIGLAAISFAPNPASIVEREGRRLQAVLELASEEAVTQGVELALAISKEPETGSSQYQILRLDKQTFEWQSLQPETGQGADRLWAVHTMDENIELSLELEGDQLSQQQLEQIARMRALATSDAQSPSILMLSSGELTPFTLSLNYRTTDYRVAVSSDGFSGVFLQ